MSRCGVFACALRPSESSLYTAFKNYYNHLWFVYSSEKPNE